MKQLIYSSVLIFFALTGCRHPETPVPVVDPLTYVPEMAGNHHWKGIQYSYNNAPGGSDYFDSSIKELDHSIYVITTQKLYFLDSLYYLGSDATAHTITFTLEDKASATGYIRDTLVYNYTTHLFVYKEYEYSNGHGYLTKLQSP